MSAHFVSSILAYGLTLSSKVIFMCSPCIIDM